MHGSYSVTRGQILSVGVPKGPKYFRSMTEGELNDRNNIFLLKYYALFFLGTSNTYFGNFLFGILFLFSGIVLSD